MLLRHEESNWGKPENVSKKLEFEIMAIEDDLARHDLDKVEYIEKKMSEINDSNNGRYNSFNAQEKDQIITFLNEEKQRLEKNI